MRAPTGTASGLAALAFLALAAVGARADWFADTGYTALSAELGAGLPTGAGVNVAQVESPLDPTTRNQYLPDTIPASNPEFLASGSTAAANFVCVLESERQIHATPGKGGTPSGK